LQWALIFSIEAKLKDRQMLETGFIEFERWWPFLFEKNISA
jgi:hypothetical protein